LRILQIITPRRFSGAERVCAQLCEGLQRRGHEVLVATKPVPDFMGDLARRGVAIENVRVQNKFDFSRPLAIARVIRRFRADIVHTHLSTASQWGMTGAYLAGVPSVAHVHAMSRAIWYIWATHTIACAEAVREYLIRQGRPPERISTVYNAVDLPAPGGLDPAEARLRLGIPADARLIAVAAHLSPKKGIHVLLRSLAALRPRFPDVHCAVMGEGGYRGALERLADELGVAACVHFAGFRDDAREIMGAADVVCLPSVRGEGLPLCVLEGSVRSRPVVATELGGVRESVLDGESGFVVAPGDPQELADRLGVLLADADLRERMGRAGRALVLSRFNLEGQVMGVEAVYRRALETKQSGRHRPQAPGS